MPVGLFDLFTVAVGTVGYLIGRRRGLVWQLSGVVTLVVGGLSATVLSRPLGALFADGMLGRFVAWVGVYALVAICLYVLSLRLKHRIEDMEFDELDRRFGGAVGAFKGLLAFAVITLVGVALAPPVKAAVEGSASGRALRVIVHELRPLLPERVYEAFGPWLGAVGDPQPTPQPGPEPGPEPGPPQLPAPGPAASAPASERPQAPPASPSPSAPQPALRPLGPPEAEAPTTLRPVELPELPPAPRPRPAPLDDPFDTSDDPPDPLAPPR